MKNDYEERYQMFQKIVREAEFDLNIAPEDLEVIAEFLKARAQTKRIIRDANEIAIKASGFPLNLTTKHFEA